MNKIRSFTLAEILTVLTLMGVIAATIIPNTIINVNKQKKEAMLQKLYSAFEINIQTVLAESNCVSVSCLRKYGNKTLVERINAKELHNGAFSNPSYFAISTECSKCLENRPVMPLEMNTATRSYAVYRLTNGAIMALYDYEGNCVKKGPIAVAKDEIVEEEAPDGSIRMVRKKTPYTNVPVCGIVVFDVNAGMGPNAPGADRFAYVIVDEPVDGSYLVPFGYSDKDDEKNKSQYNRRGLVKSKIGGDGGKCAVGASGHPEYGYNCTAKIMVDGWKIRY
ncbi:MAG: type II secretion system GspH family protein [bacterium]|nr:type II secretion system GspH family protein [bacterium]